LETANRELIESRQQLETYTAELKRSEQRYRLLAENVTDTIWTMSLEPLRFTYITPSVERMRGYSLDEALALSLEETLTPESLGKVAKALEEELIRETSGNADPNRSRTLELQQYCKDGSSRWAEAKTSFLRDEGGKAVGLLGVTRDISDRKRAEQLDQAKIAAEASSAAKSEFLSNMSHELRTPLNHIMGFTELMLEKNFGDLTETQAEYLTDIYKSSEHLLSLVNQVLAVSKIEAGKLDLNKSEINLKKILEQCLLFMDKAAERNIHLTTDIDQIPETIIADELRVKQIIYNLLSNAVKFTDDGGNIRLEARMTTGPEPVTPAETGSVPSDVEISVVDTGIGIRKEDIAKIFDPFAQLESASSRKYPGTGLGLSLTRSLVEMHGGRIWVESAGPGKGSSFRFTLPIQR
ncbi:MAG: PAS domain S-box protein, partial [Proteobacteria bacterium]|nr:PAS domain S-box protein [Pseudomonadota bacterium]